MKTDYEKLEKALLTLPNLIDKRNKLPTWNTEKADLIESTKHLSEKDKITKRWYRKRGLHLITSLAIHHSLTFTGSPEAFARHHINHLGWPGIGYPFVIEDDRDEIAWCWDLDVRTAHVGNSNTSALGICLIGDFRTTKPKEYQLQNAADLSMILINHIPAIKEIKAHQNYPGYDWKECPSFDVMKITNRMKALKF